jgi:hypothetical protein
VPLFPFGRGTAADAELTGPLEPVRAVRAGHLGM